MFAVIYHWTLKPGHEAAFRKGWEEATRIFARESGSLGSSLFQESDGSWTAIACWPSKDARDAANTASPVPETVWQGMQAAVQERFEPRELTLDTYLWKRDIRENP